MTYLLNNYHVTGKQILRSFFLSEYARRHFCKARQSPTWLNRTVHSLIAFVESLPILGQIASLFELCIFNLHSSKAAPVAQRNIRHTPYRSHIHEHHSCLNEVKTPHFEQYARGVIELHPQEILSPEIASTGADIVLSFSHEGKVFYKQHEKANSHLVAIYLQNLPYNKIIELAIEICSTSGPSTYTAPVKILVDKICAVYSLSQKENDATLSSTLLPEPVTTPPTQPRGASFAWAMFSRPLTEPLTITILQENQLDFSNDLDIAQENHYTIENKTSLKNILILELAAQNYPSSEAYISAPIMIPPGQTKSLSKTDLSNFWKDAYQIAKDEIAPREPLLCLNYIQQDVCR